MIPGYEFKNPTVVEQIEREYPAMTTEYKKIMMEQYVWKWGANPHNQYGTNSKIPPNKQFRGFKV